MRILIFTMLYLKQKTKKKTPGDIIILHLWSNILDDMTYSSWDIECGSLKLVIMGQFLSFDPSFLRTHNHNFGKMKKIDGDIIICNMCIKNHNHMQHGSWDTEWDRKNFLSFWAIFCPFTLPPKNQNFCVPKLIIIWLLLPEI